MGQGAGLLDAGRGDADVIIVGQGELDEVGQRGSLKSSHHGRSARELVRPGSRLRTELTRDGGVGTVVIGADGAAGQEEQKGQRQDGGLRIADCGLNKVQPDCGFDSGGSLDESGPPKQGRDGPATFSNPKSEIRNPKSENAVTTKNAFIMVLLRLGPAEGRSGCDLKRRETFLHRRRK
jgi:hypothetical protein